MTPKEKELYVDRLEKMINQGGGCKGRCPAQIRFRAMTRGIKRWRTTSMHLYKAHFGEDIRKDVCTFCKNFVGLGDDSPCPCGALKPEQAYKTALIAIEAWRAGKWKGGPQ